MRMRFLAPTLFLMAACTALHAQQDTALETQLQPLIQAHHGHVTLYAHELKSGKTVAINADTPVPTASVIKLTVLFEALKQIQEGKTSFDAKLTLTKGNQVEGSGVLMFFDAPQTLTLKDVLTMMI